MDMTNEEAKECGYIEGTDSTSFDCMGVRVLMKDGTSHDFDPFETWNTRGYEGEKYLLDNGHQWEWPADDVEDILEYELHFTDEYRYQRYFPTLGEWK